MSQVLAIVAMLAKLVKSNVLKSEKMMRLNEPQCFLTRLSDTFSSSIKKSPI